MTLTWPLKGVGKTPGIYVTQWFGDNYKLYHDNFGMDGHNGIDIGAPLGTPVYAPHDGYIVENVQKDTGYGLRIQIYFEEDGYGWEVILGHFKTGSSQFEEIPYDRNNRSHPVKAGQLIALVNSTGFSTGNHCHIGIRQYKNGQLLNSGNGFFGSIDPKPYLQGEPGYMNDHVKIINYKGTIFIGVGAEDIPQAVALGKAFGKPVLVDDKGNITNADITV